MQNVHKEFLGKIFKYRTEVDLDGKALWNKKIDYDFSRWINQLRDENRELFKIQYSLSSNSCEVLEKLKELIGIYDESLLVRAIAITFINFIDTRKGRPILKRLEEYKGTGGLDSLMEGDRVKKNLYFSPLGMRDVEAYSKLSGYKKSKVIQNALYSVLLISINEDEEINKFWEGSILEQITTIAKAA